MTDADFILYYDGACSICRRNMQWLLNKDKKGRISFVNISEDGFHLPEICRKLNITRIDLNTSLHIFKSDGTYAKDLDAIHLAYCAVGLGYLTALSRVIGIRQLTDYCFTKWKRHIRGI